MMGLQKTKQVSWAANGNLCQVKLFSSDDCPSKVGIGTKINMHSIRKTVGTKINLQSKRNTVGSKLAHIPLVRWTCPPTFVLSPSLRVAAGEESEEVNTENQRELRVLESVYPRPSATPPNPIVSWAIGNASIDDSRTPSVPLTPIEEEEAEKAVLPSSVAQTPLENGTPSDCAPPQLTAATPATLTTANGPENLIDPELLMKILSNPAIYPAILEQWITSKGNPSPPQNAPPLSQPSLVAPVQSAAINPICNPSTPSFTAPSIDISYPSTTITAFPIAAQPTVPSNIAVAAPLVKDMNYYKSLIQQHGSEMQRETIRPQSISHPVGSNPTRQIKDSKPKYTKSCVYFNTLKGCRNGAKCTYQHDPSFRKRTSNIIEMQSAKRMKVDTLMRGSKIYS